jgi:hypothetical protein
VSGWALNPGGSWNVQEMFEVLWAKLVERRSRVSVVMEEVECSLSLSAGLLNADGPPPLHLPSPLTVCPSAICAVYLSVAWCGERNGERVGDCLEPNQFAADIPCIFLLL